MSNEGYHEPVEELSDRTRDMHRAIVLRCASCTREFT